MEKILQYFGGKQRISKIIIPILKEYQNNCKYFLEPFVGGCNIISEMPGRRYASDINEYLIEMYIALQNGWLPPKNLSKEEYEYVKNNKEKDKALAGFVGIGCSYAGKWFGGYAKDNTDRNYCLNAYNTLEKLLPKIIGIKFKCVDYRTLTPKHCLIYCDPPYASTTKYNITGGFNSNEFWDVMRFWSKNNTVIVSEYVAPDDFETLLEIKTKLDIRNKENVKEERVEKLFIIKC